MVSVIIPVYNIMKIKSVFMKSVKSVLNQTYKDIELVLVNDGSRDNSLEFLKRLEQKDSRINLVCKENGGVESARRFGLENAHGEFVMHMDQDDVLMKDTVEIFLNQMISSDSDVVTAQCVHFFKFPQIRLKMCHDDPSKKAVVLDHDEFMKKKYQGLFGMYQFPINIWNKMYRKSYLDAIPTPPLTGLINEDLSYNLNVLPYAKRVSMLPNRTYGYRWGGFTAKYMPKLLDDAFSCYRIKLDKIKELNLPYDFEFTTCIELINYINSFFYQLVVYKNPTKEEFEKKANEIMSTEEFKHAVMVVQDVNTYHTDILDIMMSMNIDEIYKMEVERKNQEKYKLLIRRLLSL
ncbi:MAG: glycosyltransferase family 2 protein [Clostridia bacterium]|nr:glycosyltransferase family 2 protein [Clostridia bacterium]